MNANLGLTHDEVGAAEENEEEDGSDDGPILEETGRDCCCLRPDELHCNKANETYAPDSKKCNDMSVIPLEVVRYTRRLERPRRGVGVWDLNLLRKSVHPIEGTR